MGQVEKVSPGPSRQRPAGLQNLAWNEQKTQAFAQPHLHTFAHLTLIHSCPCMHSHKKTQTFTHTHTPRRTLTHSCSHMHTHTWAKRTHTHAHTHPESVHSYMDAQTPRRIYPPQENTHTHTHTPRRPHISTRMRAGLPKAARAFPRFLAWSWWKLSPVGPSPCS